MLAPSASQQGTSSTSTDLELNYEAAKFAALTIDNIYCSFATEIDAERCSTDRASLSQYIIAGPSSSRISVHFDFNTANGKFDGQFHCRREALCFVVDRRLEKDEAERVVMGYEYTRRIIQREADLWKFNIAPTSNSISVEPNGGWAYVDRSAGEELMARGVYNQSGWERGMSATIQSGFAPSRKRKGPEKLDKDTVGIPSGLAAAAVEERAAAAAAAVDDGASRSAGSELEIHGVENWFQSKPGAS